jgi:acyl carrier protein
MNGSTNGARRQQVDAAVTGVFAEVFGQDEITQDDDFFALGGSSLSAAILVSKLEDRLGAEIPLRLLMENGRVGTFVDRLVETLDAQVG